MASLAELELIVRDLFTDVALLVGTAATVHHWEDQALWTLLRRLDGLRSRTLARLARHQAGGGRSATAFPQPVHPAVELFLLRNRHHHHHDRAATASTPTRPTTGP